MCNSHERRIGYTAYLTAMRALDLAMPAWQTEHDLAPADDVRISDVAPVMRAAGDVVELAPMAFGFPPATPKRGPVFNFRSESRDFDKSNRCLIPASAFFEFTGAKYPKTKRRFMAVARLWRDGGGNQPAAVTMLTTRPRADVAASIQARGRLALPAGGRIAGG